METVRYGHILRAHWVLILVTVLACTGGAAALAWTRGPVYAASTQLFVSTPARAGLSPSEIYQGDLSSQARAASYAPLVSSPGLAEAVIAKLGLRRSTQSVQSAIGASVVTGTVLINVTVEDSSAREAELIANTVGTEFPQFVDALESAPPGRTSGPQPTATPPVQISISSPARLPTSPKSPHKPVYLIVGVVVGLLLGIGGAVLREMLDRRIRDDAAAEAIAGAPVVGHIPRDRKARKRPLVVVEDATSVQAEAYRRLRTNLRVLTIEQSRNSLLVTSPVAREGKTLIAVNLAFAFAQAGHRVVLVDADMRRAKLSEMLDLGPAPGLSDVLRYHVIAPLHREHALPLEVLSSGSPPPNPSELLESDRFASLLESLTTQADIVIVDSPPLLPVSDAAIIARTTAAVLLVARPTSTHTDQLDAAIECLAAAGKQPIGVVLNGYSAPVSGSYDYKWRKAVEVSTPVIPVWDQ
jgi:succinoglycan biosynthesis transport protein ExoP